MKTILFSGFKGGTGKTFLATTFSKYLVDAGHRTALIGFDFQKELTYLKNKHEVDRIHLIETRAENFLNSYSQVKENFDYLIIDGSMLERDQIKLILPYTDKIATPFQLDNLNAIKLFGFTKFIQQLQYKTEDLLAIPNNNTLHHQRSDLSKRISAATDSLELTVLPAVSHVNLPGYFAYNTKQFYILRGVFLQILSHF